MELAIKIHDVAVDGYPEAGAVFFFDGCWVSGWPLHELDEDGYRLWEPNSDVGRVAACAGVRYWVTLPATIRALGSVTPPSA